MSGEIWELCAGGVVYQEEVSRCRDVGRMMGSRDDR
jgi:hypothetical protein